MSKWAFDKCGHFTDPADVFEICKSGIGKHRPPGQASFVAGALVEQAEEESGAKRKKMVTILPRRKIEAGVEVPSEEPTAEEEKNSEGSPLNQQTKEEAKEKAPLAGSEEAKQPDFVHETDPDAEEKRFRGVLDFLDTDWHKFCFSPVTGRLWVVSSDKIWVETVLKQSLSPEELMGLAACPKKKRKREDE